MVQHRSEKPAHAQSIEKTFVRSNEFIKWVYATVQQRIRPTINSLTVLADSIQLSETGPTQIDSLKTIRSSSHRTEEYLNSLEGVRSKVFSDPSQPVPIVERVTTDKDQQPEDRSFFYLDEFDPSHPPEGIVMREVKDPKDHLRLLLNSLENVIGHRVAEVTSSAKNFEELWQIEPERFREIIDQGQGLSDNIKRIASIAQTFKRREPLTIVQFSDGNEILDLRKIERAEESTLPKTPEEFQATLNEARQQIRDLIVRTLRDQIGNDLTVVDMTADELIDDPNLPEHLREAATIIAQRANQASKRLRRITDAKLDQTIVKGGLTYLDLDRPEDNDQPNT